MKKLFKKLSYFIVSIFVLAFAFAIFLVNSPNAEAAGTNTETLTFQNIYDNNSTGTYGKFSWDPSKLKEVTSTYFVINPSRDPFVIVYTPASSGAPDIYSFAIDAGEENYTANIDVERSESALSYSYSGSGTRSLLNQSVPSSSSSTTPIYFGISKGYMHTDIKISTLTLQLKTTYASIKVAAGTGVKSVYLSTSQTATSGSTSGTNFNKGQVVYAFAVLNEGYNRGSNNWTLVNGTANTENAIYRIGNTTVGTKDYDFGTINAQVKTKTITLNKNGGGSSTNLQLTYGQTATLQSLSRNGFEFLGWNSKADGTGTAYGDENGATLTVSQVNEMVLNTNAVSVYAQWLQTATIVTLNKQGGTGGADSVLGIEDEAMPEAVMPTRSGYIFNGYFAETNGAGKQYYNADGTSANNWDSSDTEVTLYAYWTIKTAVQNVIDKIDAIGEVKYPDSLNKINEAREAYDALDTTDNGGVSNYATLTDAEASYEQLKNDGANTVDALINTIGDINDIEYPTSGPVIKAARDGYNALTEEQKALVTKYNDLLAIEEEYSKLEDIYMAENVDGLINGIGEVEYPDSLADIEEVREAYDALTDKQKELIQNLDVLEAAEAKYDVLETADYINKIGTVEYTATSKTKIDNARKAYNELTDAEKALVTNYKTLTDAEEKYAELELDATRHSLEDKDNGVKIETKDGKGIPKTITLKVEVKTTVSATEGSAAYVNITSNINGNEKISGVYDVKLLQTINGVEKEIQPSEIKEGTKIKIHIAIPEGINAIETRILHIHAENDMEYVENVEIVGNEFVFEVSRLSEFALVTLTHGIPGWAIALIIIGCLLLLCCGCYLLLFFVFNKWINKDGKAVRVFKLGKKEDKVRVFLMPCKLELKEENEIFNSKDEAMKQQ